MDSTSLALVEVVKILNEEQSLEIKKRLAQKLDIEGSVYDWEVV